MPNIPVSSNKLKSKSNIQKLTCIICNQQLPINTNDHKCDYRSLSQTIILNK
jgi:transcription elongation factor Elf1